MDRDVYAFIRRAVENRGRVGLGVGCLLELTGARCSGELMREGTPMGDHPSFRMTFLKTFQDDFWG